VAPAESEPQKWRMLRHQPMKLFALLLAPAWAAKFAQHSSASAGLVVPDCPGNVLPDDLAAGPHKTLGKAQLKDIIDSAKLRAALEGSKDWVVGKKWELRATANSFRTKPVTYAFAGGGNGFLSFTVPGGVVDMNVTSTDTVKSLATETDFEYRGEDAVVTDDDVVLTNVCLRPVTCESFEECKPSSMWKMVEDPTKPGSSREECCIQLMCKDEESCDSTKYKKSEEWETLAGSTPDRCCTPIECNMTALCTAGMWKPRPGTGLLGSTPQDCCEPRMCSEYTCEETTKKGRKAALDYDKLQGFTDSDCCEEKSCKSFKCTDSDAWLDKKDKDSLFGSTFPECCDEKFCKDFTCSPSSQYKALNATLPSGKDRPGFTNDKCCEPLSCKDYNCSKPSLKLKSGDRLGSSDEECCETRLCEDYTCSSATKWVHKADVGSKGLSQPGFSDEECCDKVMCSAFSCSPATKWKPKNSTFRESTQGSTNEECCEPLYCEAYTCSGDADGDGESTKYRKQKDTNHYKNIGSTDDECCVPKPCNAYTTSFPTMWTRKKDADLLGSTDQECYEERWCKDYCCKDKSKARRPDADKIQGSTDSECCVSKTLRAR